MVQFVCGLSLCVGQRAHLTREEISKVVQHYRTADGRVHYKEFCDIMENGTHNEQSEQKWYTS